MKVAAFFDKKENFRVKCRLCPHGCLLKLDETGKCWVRINDNGILYSENYGLISAIHLDPIEKKPLYHYYPGSKILSIGSVGCNLSCGFCQNCDISQKGVKEHGSLISCTPDSIVKSALTSDNNIGLAYTYNEPTIFFEFVLETANKVSAAGLKNVMVSNGYIQNEPLRDLLEWIDAFNIDLKSFDNEFYRLYTGGNLKPVLNSLEMIRKAGKHLEITNLIIPGLNDNELKFNDMVRWICDHLGDKTILHLSRYFPSYRFTLPSTPVNILKNLYNIARDKLPFTYLGNIHLSGSSDTLCPKCCNLLIRRSGYNTEKRGIDLDKRCSSCQLELKDFIKI